jgi:pimeloyl-ACP methyl ester carboxylesterase
MVNKMNLRVLIDQTFIALGVVCLSILPVSAQTAKPSIATPDSFLAKDQAIVDATFDKAAFEQTFKHKTSVVNGKAIHYVIGGVGEPLLLLHGWPETWYSWRRSMPSLAQNHTVIAVDLPGFGDSAALPSSDKKTVAKHLNQWMQSIGYKSAHIVGHDMGGPVAYAYAAQFPNQVKKVVFTETAIPGFGFADGTPEDILKITEQSVSGVWHFPLFMNPEKASTLIKGKEREFLNLMVRDSFVNFKAFSTDELDELTQWLKTPDGPRAGFSYYQTLFVDAKDNQSFSQTKLTMPVLVVDGGGGFLQYVTTKSVKQVAVNVKSEVVPKSGHFIAAERPEFFADVIKRFLKR